MIKDVAVPLVFAFSFIVIIIFVTYVVQKKKVKRLLKNRTGDIQSFIQSFKGYDVDLKVLENVYEMLSDMNSQSSVEFPAMINDDIEDVYGIIGEDLEYYTEQILKSTDRTWDNYENNPYRGTIITVKDLVLFVNAQPLKTTPPF